MSMRTCICVLLFLWVCGCMHEYVLCVHICEYVCVCMCVYVCIYMSTCVCLCICVYDIYNDMLLVYKCLHGDLNWSPSDLGFSLVTSCTRGSRTRCLRLCRQPVRGNICASLFYHRAAASWNRMPVCVVTSTSQWAFKIKLYNYLFDIQCSNVDE